MAPTSFLRALLPLRMASSFPSSRILKSPTINVLAPVFSCPVHTTFPGGTRRTISTSNSATKDQQQQPPQTSPPPSSSLLRSSTTGSFQSPSLDIPPPSDLTHPAPTTTTTTTEPPAPTIRTYPYTIKRGTVVSVGRMDRTVRVAHRHTIWDAHIRKSYPKVTHYLVSDPRNSLREGDVIDFASGYPKSLHVRHVVERIVAPFGTPMGDRPPVMTRDERDAERALKRANKARRREARRASPASPVQQEHVGRIRALVLQRVAGQEHAGLEASTETQSMPRVQT